MININTLCLYSLIEESPIVIKQEDKPNYTVDDYKNPPKKDMKKENGKPMYRSKKLPSGEIIRIAIMKKSGPRGGQTKTTSIWRPK